MNAQRRLSVLFLASSYPRHRDDTASVFLRYLAEYLADDNVNVHVLVPAERKGEKVTEGKVRVHRFQYFFPGLQGLAYGSGMLPNLKRAPWLWFQVPFYLLTMTGALLRLLASRRFDVIHAHWVLPQGLVGLLGNLFYRVPLVVSVHGTDVLALGGGFATRLKHFVLSRSAAWTANTANTSAAIEHSRLSRALIIPMGIDISLFSNGNSTHMRDELPEGEYVLLFVGRLIENKGCHDLLQAIALLPAQVRAHTALWIVGDGNQRKQLERAAKELGLSAKVQFFGTVTQPRLPDFYAAADVVVIPSKAGSSGETEGQGIVILEAFAARTCVIASAIGGIPSMVRDHVTGILVDAGNAGALSKAIEKLFNQPALRQGMAEAAFTEVRERYSWSNTAQKFKALYGEITDGIGR